MKDVPLPTPDETLGNQLGDLAATLASPPLPDPRQWAALDRALSPKPRWRRQLRLAVPALAALALLVFLGSRLTLAFRSEACAIGAEGFFSAPADRHGTLAFEEGSRFELEAGTTAELRPLGFRRGAKLTLRQGRTTVTVVRRFAGKWHVLAGPFDVRVTGTAFSVDWDPVTTAFRVRVTQGTVRVAGGGLNGETPVVAGQSLDIVANQNEITWNKGEPPPAPIALAPDTAALPAAGAATVSAEPRPIKRRRLAATKLTAPSPKGLPNAVGPSLRTNPFAQPGDPPFLVDPTLDPDPLSRPANNPSGALFVAIAERGKFLAPADLNPTHLYKEHNRICTRFHIAALMCGGNTEMAVSQNCNWVSNWGAMLGWRPRSDHKPWGQDRANRIALDFTGTSGHYRLVAHNRGDPFEKVYCVDGYVSGQLVKPADFRTECWQNSGKQLTDFANVDFISIHRPSTITPQAVHLCIGAVNLE